MASHYWIKLYHEVLHDPKMGQLPDHLWRRFFELCLIAGELDEDGWLPPIDDMAWTLRTTSAELEEDLLLLEEHQLVTVDQDGTWFVTKFADRQAPVSSTERWRQWRDRQRSAEYYQTDTNAESNAAPTNRLTDTDTDTEQDTDKIEIQTTDAANAALAAAVVALQEISMGDPETVRQETRLTDEQIVETVAYAKEQKLGAGWVRNQLRLGNAYRPRAPDDGRQRYAKSECAHVES